MFWNTSLKRLRLRKLLDQSAFAYLALLGLTLSFWVLLGPNKYRVCQKYRLKVFGSEGH